MFHWETCKFTTTVNTWNGNKPQLRKQSRKSNAYITHSYFPSLQGLVTTFIKSLSLATVAITSPNYRATKLQVEGNSSWWYIAPERTDAFAVRRRRTVHCIVIWPEKVDEEDDRPN